MPSLRFFSLDDHSPVCRYESLWAEDDDVDGAEVTEWVEEEMRLDLSVGTWGIVVDGSVRDLRSAHLTHPFGESVSHSCPSRRCALSCRIDLGPQRGLNSGDGASEAWQWGCSERQAVCSGQTACQWRSKQETRQSELGKRISYQPDDPCNDPYADNIVPGDTQLHLELVPYCSERRVSLEHLE